MISRHLITGTIILLTLTCPTDAAPIPSGRRVAYDPAITNPNAGTTWQVGSKTVITWDTSAIPKGSKAKGKVLLGHAIGADPNEHLDIEHPLAEDFELSAGFVEATVPEVEPGRNYIVVLMGDSGNKSPPFSIE
ncbi:hypothetical protein BV22DRAFT_1199597 [Leucogyrophana mollusca]|uniref:Uncharacterized protein n=1 Tax=Leucogyrophana mollusca TaxID=85980 RepID=A0ACB8B1G5_9AGAM|nr:hypothetical protein BV22DRAFT_1199597 [Leucogyrophana mollusca]